MAKKDEKPEDQLDEKKIFKGDDGESELEIKHDHTEKHEKEKAITEDDDKDDKEDDDEDLKESIDTIFAGSDISDEVKSKLSAIFVAAVNESVSRKVDALVESKTKEIRDSLREEVEDRYATLVENTEKYIDYVTESFMEDNKIAIESGIKVEIAESLIASLTSTLVEHNISIDEEKMDVLSDLEKQLDESKKEIAAVEARNIRLISENRQMKADRAFEEIAEGMTDTEKDRLHVLSEKISVSDIETYKSDLATLKEHFFKDETKKTPKHTVDLNEEVQIEVKAEEKPVSFSQALSKIVSL